MPVKWCILSVKLKQFSCLAYWENSLVEAGLRFLKTCHSPRSWESVPSKCEKTLTPCHANRRCDLLVENLMWLLLVLIAIFGVFFIIILYKAYFNIINNNNYNNNGIVNRYYHFKKILEVNNFLKNILFNWNILLKYKLWKKELL